MEWILKLTIHCCQGHGGGDRRRELGAFGLDSDNLMYGAMVAEDGSENYLSTLSEMS